MIEHPPNPGAIRASRTQFDKYKCQKQECCSQSAGDFDEPPIKATSTEKLFSCAHIAGQSTLFGLLDENKQYQTDAGDGKQEQQNNANPIHNHSSLSGPIDPETNVDYNKKERSKLTSLFDGAEEGTRTLTVSRSILSRVRLPIPPPRRDGLWEFTIGVPRVSRPQRSRLYEPLDHSRSPLPEKRPVLSRSL